MKPSRLEHVFSLPKDKIFEEKNKRFHSTLGKQHLFCIIISKEALLN